MCADTLKVVVRLLPPEITEEEFKATVPEVHRENTKWWFFHAGKRSTGDAKPSLNARCYMQFETSAQAEDFIGQYHGHQFVDGQGENFRAVACIAPYQKAPRKSQRDPRDGTIEDDATYKEFAAKLQEKQIYDPPANPRDGLRPAEGEDTPLVQFMKQRVADRKARWEKKQSKRWSGYMDAVPEDSSKKSKWYCGECGSTRHLEEDPDARGTFYCTYCWDQWEVKAAEAKTKKKKKKKDKEEESYAEVDESTSKKKKKKKKDKEGEDDYSQQEWRAKDSKSSWDEGAYEEEATTTKKKKKKKKEAEEEAWAEEETTSTRRWRAKQKDDWGEDWGESKSSGHSKGKSSGYAKDEWWEEDKPSRSSDRWKAKSSAESGGWEQEEEKSSSRSRRDKDSRSEGGGGKGGGGGGRWAPKARNDHG